MKALATASALAAALFAYPALAATPSFSGGAHFSGGGHFSGGHASGGHFGAGPHTAGAGRFGPSFSGTRPNGTSPSWSGSWSHGWRHHHEPDGDDFFVFDPFWGWGDPFLWGGVGFVAGYDMVPYWDSYDDYEYGSAPPPASGAPPGYDCDGWRWDAGQQRYVPAKVACQ
jgi:hypothetical protein